MQELWLPVHVYILTLTLLVGNISLAKSPELPAVNQTITGPNCFNYALWQAGHVEYLREVRGQEISVVLSQNNCQAISGSKKRTGDIGILLDKQVDAEQKTHWYPGHAFAVCDENQVCEKAGIFKDTPYRRISLQNSIQFQLQFSRKPYPREDCIGVIGMPPAHCGETVIKYYRCMREPEHLALPVQEKLSELEKTLSENVFSSSRLSTELTMAKFTEVIADLMNEQSLSIEELRFQKLQASRLYSLLDQFSLIEMSRRPNTPAGRIEVHNLLGSLWPAVVNLDRRLNGSINDQFDFFLR